MTTTDELITTDWGPSPFPQQGIPPKVVAVASHEESMRRFLDEHVYRVGTGMVWSMMNEHPDILAQETGGAAEVEHRLYESSPLFTTKQAADEAALRFLIENELIDGLLLDASFGVRFSVLTMRRALQDTILKHHRSGKIRAHMLNLGATPGWAGEIAGDTTRQSDEKFIKSLYDPETLAPHRDAMRLRLEQAIRVVKSRQSSNSKPTLHVIKEDGRREAV